MPDRHSDKAAQVLVDSKAGFERVLEQHGYAGTPYPRKVFIVTEVNLARRQISETLG